MQEVGAAKRHAGSTFSAKARVGWQAVTGLIVAHVRGDLLGADAASGRSASGRERSARMGGW